MLPTTLKAKKTKCTVGVNAQARVFILDQDETKHVGEVSFSSPELTVFENEGHAVGERLDVQ